MSEIKRAAAIIAAYAACGIGGLAISHSLHEDYKSKEAVCMAETPRADCSGQHEIEREVGVAAFLFGGSTVAAGTLTGVYAATRYLYEKKDRHKR